MTLLCLLGTSLTEISLTGTANRQGIGRQMSTIELLIRRFGVTEQIILNDEAALKRCQSFYSSGIDKINERLGSMSLISRGAYAKEPVLNGFSAGQINVTIGGMKMFGACTDKMDPVTSYIEPVNLKSIRIDEGSGGSKNGSTIGGTFDMELQSPERSTFTVETGANYETASQGKNAFFISNYGKEKWAFTSISGVYRHYPRLHSDGTAAKCRLRIL